MQNSILVKIYNYHDCVDIVTVSRKRERNGRFTPTANEISDLIKDGRRIVHSYNGFADMMLSTDRSGTSLALITFYRISEDISGKISGHTETILIPMAALASCAEAEGSSWKGLSRNTDKPVRFEFQASNLHNVISDPFIRRKFAKFLSNNFDWKGTKKIVFYNDYNPYDFFFEEYTSRGKGLCGGVIYHDMGDKKRARYSIHT